MEAHVSTERSAEAVLEQVQQALGAAERSLYEASAQQRGGALYFMARVEGEQKLVVVGETEAVSETFEASTVLASEAAGPVRLCPLTPENAQALRAVFPWAAPTALGTASALGCGDRLGLATPGHLRACRAAAARPVLAQQSIREMTRTGRTPQQVLDDVTWAVFQEGFEGGFGADADHLKRTEDVDACFEVGYTMYTVDPSDYVDDEADDLDPDALEARYAALPWDALEATPEACLKRYVEAPPKEAAALGISFDEKALQRAAVKYGAALAHTKKMARHLAARYAADRPGEAYDLEMSVDETEHPTRPREHFFVAAELRRLGVEVTSLAPRFTGDFQKGIDFIGDLGRFEEAFRQHAAIAEASGGYKLSIHSGSDKFSAYPAMGRYAGACLHLKTAGTSYLEALRLPARYAPDFFREIVAYAFTRFEKDKKTYHVTTTLDAIPAPTDVSDEELERAYLDKNDGRQLLHLTYGSVLTAEDETGAPRFKERFFTLLDEHEEEHYDVLEQHFRRHVEGVGGAFAASAA